MIRIPRRKVRSLGALLATFALMTLSLGAALAKSTADEDSAPWAGTTNVDALIDADDVDEADDDADADLDEDANEDLDEDADEDDQGEDEDSADEDDQGEDEDSADEDEDDDDDDDIRAP